MWWNFWSYIFEHRYYLRPQERLFIEALERLYRYLALQFLRQNLFNSIPYPNIMIPQNGIYSISGYNISTSIYREDMIVKDNFYIIRNERVDYIVNKVKQIYLGYLNNRE